MWDRFPTRCVLTSRSGGKNSEKISWLMEFLRDSHASSSHEPSFERTPTRREVLGKDSVFSHFLED